jgi:uncharacterized OsmC-like protein
MTADQIRDALNAATAYLTEHPAEARYTDSRATARIGQGLKATVTGDGDELLTTDMPASVGGGDGAPSPGWFLRAAEASCVATLIAMRAAQLDLQLAGVEVTVDSESDDRGILGIDATVPAGPLSTRITVRVGLGSSAPPADPKDVEAIVAWAVDHCPVTDAVRRAVPLVTEVTVA